MKVTTALTLASVLCGNLFSGTNAVTGDAQVVSAYNHQSVVSFDGRCTGTLISPGVVLTAQHCVLDTDENIRKQKVYLPALPGQTKRTSVGIERVVRYDDFKFRTDLKFEEIVEMKNLNRNLAKIKSEIKEVEMALNPTCNCKKEWEYESETYFGCDARAPDSPVGQWCFTQGKCVGKDFRFCQSFNSAFTSVVDKGSIALKAMIALLKDSLRGELFTLFRGDVALLFLDQCILDRRPVEIDIDGSPSKYKCEKVQNVGYGSIQSAGNWRDDTAPRNDKKARAAYMQVLSPQACMMADTHIYLDYFTKKYFSDPTKWYYSLKKPVLQFLQLEHKLLANGKLGGLRLQEKPVLCVAPIDERMQMPNSGDSGGPIFREDMVQIGVNSHKGGWRWNGLSSGITAYFGELSYYSEWINENVETSACGWGARRRLRSPFQSSRRSLSARRRRLFLQELAGIKLQGYYGVTKESAFGIAEKLKQMDQCPTVDEDFVDSDGEDIF